MTNEKALKIAKSTNPLLIGSNNGEEKKQYVERIISALDKQTPKKPTLHEQLFLGKKIKAPYCPNCGDSFNCNEFGNVMRFCWECGQALDWSECDD